MSKSAKNFQDLVDDFRRLQLEQEYKNNMIMSLQTMSNSQKIYYTYISPVLLLLFLFLLIALYRFLWTDNFWKKYGIMFCYTVIDLTSLWLQGIMMFVYLQPQNRYIEFKFCKIFLTAISYVPCFCFGFSQWLKVFQGFQRFIIVYRATDYIRFLNRKTVSAFMITAVLVCLISPVLLFLQTNIEKAYKIDEDTNEQLEICREKYDSPNHNNSERRIVTITIITITFIIPFIFLVVLTFLLVITIRKQQRFRQQFTSSERIDKQTTRLVHVVVAVNIVFAIGTLISAVEMISTGFEDQDVNDAIFWENMAIGSAILYRISIPVTVILFSYLSKTFRHLFRRICVCCTKCERNDE